MTVASVAANAAGQTVAGAARPRRPARLVIAALVIALAVIAVKGVAIARYDAAILDFPFQVDDAEGVVLAEAQLIGQGQNPYAFQPSPAPYFIAGPYPPVYTLLNSIGMRVFGPTFKFGRAVQLLGTLAVAAWLAWAVARAGRGRVAWLVGVWAAGLFLTAHLVAVWSVRVRPDMTALAANLAGVALLRGWWEAPERTAWRAAAWPRGGELARLAAGAACFALGWWTKQTFIAVPLAFTLVLLLRRPKAGVTLGALYGAGILVPFGALTLLTGGGFFQKTVTYQGSWEWTAFRRLAQPFAEQAEPAGDLRDRCESGAERELFDWLSRRGYRVTPQARIGAFRIDLLVEGGNDARLAVECDGDRYEGPARWADDIRRQRALERAGWVFWRCFAASLVLRRDEVLADLTATLEALGIRPVATGAAVPGVHVEARRVRVKTALPARAEAGQALNAGSG